MEVISQRPSNLNPHAPIFVPLAYQAVEDFSDEWWALIQSSPAFHGYWLRRYSDDLVDEEDDDFLFPDDLDDFIFGPKDEEKEKAFSQEVMRIGTHKWDGGRSAAKSPRFVEKAPKIVNVKVSPRTIHQPR